MKRLEEIAKGFIETVDSLDSQNPMMSVGFFRDQFAKALASNTSEPVDYSHPSALITPSIPADIEAAEKYASERCGIRPFGAEGERVYHAEWTGFVAGYLKALTHARSRPGPAFETFGDVLRGLASHD